MDQMDDAIKRSLVERGLHLTTDDNEEEEKVISNPVEWEPIDPKSFKPLDKESVRLSTKWTIFLDRERLANH